MLAVDVYCKKCHYDNIGSLDVYLLLHSTTEIDPFHQMDSLFGKSIWQPQNAKHC